MNEFTSYIWEAYENGRFTDLTINCGTETFKTHKLIVCARSKVFDKMVQSVFKEGSTNVISLGDETPAVLRSALEWMYKSDYTYQGTAGIGALLGYDRPKPLCHHAYLYAFADKYDIRELSEKSASMYKSMLLAQMDSRPADLPAVTDLLESFHVVYSSTPDSNRRLRKEIIAALRAHGSSFRNAKASEGVDYGALLKKAIEKVPQLANDLVDDFLVSPNTTCNSCAFRTGRPDYGFGGRRGF